MNKILLQHHLKKANMSAKDRAEFINALSGGGGSGELEQRVSNIEKVLSEILEGFEMESTSETVTTRI